jgi:hypothetical protein
MVIGLHGPIGAGKNAAARRLALLHPNVVEVSFAAKLKESAAALLGCTVAEFEQWKNEGYRQVAVGVDVDGLGFVPTSAQTVRVFLQRYGTEAHRDVFGEDFWLDEALPLGRDYSDALYVVTDVRFPNEAERVWRVDGIVVYIHGVDAPRDQHPSEQPVDWDVAITNAIRDDNFASLDRSLTILLDEFGLTPPERAAVAA